MGTARCIQITRNTYELVKDAFDCEAMGLIEVKGAGQMEVWHVLGRKKFATAAGSGRRGSTELTDNSAVSAADLHGI